MIVKFKKIHPQAKLPYKKHDSDACYDVYCTSIKDLGDGRIEYGLGFALGLPERTQLDLRPRSSIHKTGLLLSNSIGTGDEAYTGEYKAVFYNVLPQLPNYEVGDRILQIQIPGYRHLEFVEVESLDETERGDGGFGSTGMK